MNSIVFRSSVPEPSAPKETLPDPVVDKNIPTGHDDSEPIDIYEERGKDIVLDALGIDDMVQNMPKEEQDNLREVKKYTLDIIRSKGMSPTINSFKKTLESIKDEMGLDPDANPEIVLDRIGGVVNAWRQLSFVTNSTEKRSLFMKMARMQSSKDMNKFVFQEMERRSIWR